MLLSSRSRAGQRRSTSHFGENVSITLAEHMTNWNSSFAPYWQRFAFGVRIAIVDGFTASGMRHLSFHIGGTASQQEICRRTATLLLERYNRSDALWRSQKLAGAKDERPGILTAPRAGTTTSECIRVSYFYNHQTEDRRDERLSKGDHVVRSSCESVQLSAWNSIAYICKSLLRMGSNGEVRRSAVCRKCCPSLFEHAFVSIATVMYPNLGAECIIKI